MNNQQIINWLLDGDVSIQFQVWRDLLGNDKKEIQDRIAYEGWGHAFLTSRTPDGHWGDRFYQPKWTSTHYTLLDLRNLNFPRDNYLIRESINMILTMGKSDDGGIQLGPSTREHSDICVNGMFLNYASYFKAHEKDLRSIVDSILAEIMPDGGFNCRTTRSGAKHSSFHTTISVLEGFTEFLKSGHSYRSSDITDSIKSGVEFLLLHRLFLSDHTGRIINPDFLKMRYPCRWKYDIYRALDYFQYAGILWDQRMSMSIDQLYQQCNKEGTWNMKAGHPGKVHFTMEEAGKPGRWNTLRALRILKHFNK